MSDDLWLDEPGETPLTAEEKLQLRPSLSTRAQLNEVERLNLHAARLWAMRQAVLRRPDLVTDAFARELHRRMFNQIWRWAGKYRTSDRNLGWDWSRIPEGMRVLLYDARYWQEHVTYPPAEIALRLHHRMVVIHPWPNGNGRHARLLADILVAARGLPPLTWGARLDLVQPGAARAQYISALQAADRNDYTLLLAFASS
ncbi:MAG: mobile mystery protein B [Lacunisphaera sp.]|nr:mobile mystery protein B [Lacunisphaera sp.]